MHRIDTSTAVLNLHGTGKHGFGGGDPVNGIPATRFTPDWCNDLQENVSRVIELAGIALEKGNGDQLAQAVVSLIASGRDLMPIYPTIETAGNTLSVTVGSGTVMVAAGQTWVWRGIQRYSSDAYTQANRTFATLPNKTYHLRWTADAGFRLRDLADGAYNPGAKTEDNPAFDGTYDDMLVARVVTNASNVATVTALANTASLYARSADMVVLCVAGLDTQLQSAGGSEAWVNIRFEGLNWARKPTIALVQGAQLNFSSTEMNFCMLPALYTRYRALGTYSGSPGFTPGDGVYMTVECLG